MRSEGHGIRPCLDMRVTNKKIIAPLVQVEPIQTLLHRMSGSTVFTISNAKEAYYSLTLHPDSQVITAFTFEGRQFVFTRLVMGMKSSCAIFQNAMHQLFPLKTRDFLALYLDNLLVFSASSQDHFRQLSHVYDKLKETNISLNFRKSQFLLSKVSYLGHVVSGGEIKVNPSINKPIQKFPLPKTRRQLRRFLGICN